MKVVLDTNVLVAGLLNPFGPCGEIVRMLTGSEVILCVDARILTEYHDVLHRPRFAFDPLKVQVLLDYLETTAEAHPTSPWPITLPDPDDQPLLEVALAAKDHCLVSGNLKHFPVRCRRGVRILAPAKFLDDYKRHSTDAADP